MRKVSIFLSVFLISGCIAYEKNPNRTSRFEGVHTNKIIYLKCEERYLRQGGDVGIKHKNTYSSEFISKLFPGASFTKNPNGAQIILDVQINEISTKSMANYFIFFMSIGLIPMHENYEYELVAELYDTSLNKRWDFHNEIGADAWYGWIFLPAAPFKSVSKLDKKIKEKMLMNLAYDINKVGVFN